MQEAVNSVDFDNCIHNSSDTFSLIFAKVMSTICGYAHDKSQRTISGSKQQAAPAVCDDRQGG